MPRKTTPKLSERFQKVTIYYGYALFGLLLIAIILSTVIPFGNLFFAPTVINKSNVLLLLSSLVAGALLPFILAYLLGDKITHAKSKQLHRFNGVLFGFTAYWTSLFFTFISFSVVLPIREHFAEPLATVLTNWPVAATLAIIALVAWPYARTPGKASVLETSRYRSLLIGSILAVHTYLVANLFIYPSDQNALISVATYVIALAALFTISYKSLARQFPHPATRVTAAAVAASVAYIAATYTGQLLSSVTSTILVTIIPIATGLVTWVAFLLLVRHKK